MATLKKAYVKLHEKATDADVIASVKTREVAFSTEGNKLIGKTNAGVFLHWVRNWFRDTVSYSTLAAALTDIGSSSRELIVSTAISITSNTTVPANIHLRMVKGGSITVSAGITLTISGPFRADLFQVFYGDGTVLLAAGTCEAINPEWWGANGLAKAVAAAGSVNHDIRIQSTETLSANLTVPTNVFLDVRRGGSFAGAFTLTLNGGMRAGTWQIFDSSITVSAASKVLPILLPEWWGAKGDDATNDATAVSAALTTASSAGGGLVQAMATTYFIGASTITIPSNVSLIGRGSSSTMFRSSGGVTVFSIPNTTTNVKLAGFKISITSWLYPSNGIDMTGLDLNMQSSSESDIVIDDIAFHNLHSPIRAAYVKGLSILNISASIQDTTGYPDAAGGIVVRLTGCSDVTIDGLSVPDGKAAGTLPPGYTGISGGVGFINGGKVYGCRNVRINNVTCHKLINQGIAAVTGFPEIYGGFRNVYGNVSGYTAPVASDIGLFVKDGGGNTVGILKDYDVDSPNPWWNIQWRTPNAENGGTDTTYDSITYGSTLSVDGGTGVMVVQTMPSTKCIEFEPSGYVSAISGDIGKTVKQGATTIGTLASYDNDNFRWYLAAEASNVIPNTATTIDTGTGSGTSFNWFDYVVTAPDSYNSVWTNLHVTNSFNPEIGQGAAIDSCWFTHLSNFVFDGHEYTGLFIGDGVNTGSSVSNGSCCDNNYGIICAQGPGIQISNVDCSRNKVNGISAGKPPTGRRSENDYTMLVNCNITRNGWGGSGITYPGIRLASSHWLISNCNISENYNDGIFVVQEYGFQFRVLIVGNTINDNGWGKVATGDGVRFEGQAYFNVVRNNFIGRNYPQFSGQNYGIRWVTNANDNIAQNNYIVGNSTGPYIDDGLRNQFWDNIVTNDASAGANGTGTVVRTTGGALVYPSASTGTSTNPALTLDNPTTSSATPALRVYGNVNTNFGSEPLNRAADFLNRHADFSSDLVRIANDGVSGNVNSTNGGFLGILDNSGASYVFRVRPQNIDAGAPLGLSVTEDTAKLLATFFNPSTGTSGIAYIKVGQSASNYIALQYINSGFTPAGNLVPLQGLLYLPASTTGGLLVRCDADAPIIFSPNNTEYLRISSASVQVSTVALRLSAANTVSSSSDNSVTNKIKINVGGTDYYLLASTSSS